MYLKIVNVTKIYPGFKLGPINLTLDHNQVLVLIGATGSGKSTLLNITTGLIKPDTGSIYVDDIDITRLPIESRKIGYLTQKPSLFPHMNVYKNIVFGLKKRVEKDLELKIRSLVEAFELAHLLDKSIDMLSGGEMQKVALARMLVLEPKIMLMDEPLAHLDNMTRIKLRMDLRRLLKEKKILGLYVTHFEDDVYALADSVAILKDGLIIKSDTLKTLLSLKNNNVSDIENPMYEVFQNDHNYLEGRVIESKQGLATFLAGEHKIEILGEFPIGSVVGIMIKPEDIILTLDMIKTSARNSMKLMIVKMENSVSDKIGVIDVQLASQSFLLRSKITVESKNYLRLKEGQIINAIFKATTPHVIRNEPMPYYDVKEEKNGGNILTNP